MKINALKYEFRRMLGKTTRLDPRQPLPRGIMVGPLSFAKWDRILEGIFELAKIRANIVLAYKIQTLDEYLTFDRNKAIARGMTVDYSKVSVFDDILPNVSERWSPMTELWPMLTRKAAEQLGTEKGKPWENLAKYAGLFFALRTLEAKNNLLETVTREEIVDINKACTFFDMDFTFSV